VHNANLHAYKDDHLRERETAQILAQKAALKYWK